MMKKLLISAVLFCFLQTGLFAQTLFLETSIPNSGTNLGFGARYNMFLNITPKFEVGVMGRFHRIDVKASDEFGFSRDRIVHDVSLGLGAKYYVVNDIFLNSRFYVNPNIEISAFERDNGIDLSFYMGYTKQLGPIFSFSVDAGVRSRQFLYDMPYPKNTRFQAYVGAGLGLTLPSKGFSSFFSRPMKDPKFGDDKAIEIIEE
jgi:hypothetical protein